MRKIYDISLTVSPRMPVWPGDPPVWLERTMKLEDGDLANVTTFRSGVHAGTHIDAPFHFVPNGKTIDEISLEKLIGPVQVVEITDSVGLITGEILSKVDIEGGVKRILFKTRNSMDWERQISTFQTDFVAVDATAAQALVNLGVQLVGIDYLSISPFFDQIPTHKILLEAEVIILEGLNLSQVSAGIYELFCLPVKLGGSDGAMARAVLLANV
jgi:arylformamidase